MTSVPCGPFLTVTYSGRNLSTKQVMLVESAHRWGYSRLVVLPLGPRDNYFMKVERLRTVVRECVHCPNLLILVSDAYDAFHTSPRQHIVRRFRKLKTRESFGRPRRFFHGREALLQTSRHLTGYLFANSLLITNRPCTT